MARYLFKVTYGVNGISGVMQEGAEHRVTFIARSAADLAGSLDSFDLAFGATDAYVRVDLPDDETAAAIAMAVGASGWGR
jgi:uncharacterized protein with GYD domain